MSSVFAIADYAACRWGWIPPTIMLGLYAEINLWVFISFVAIIMFSNFGQNRIGYVEALMEHKPEFFPELFDEEDE